MEQTPSQLLQKAKSQHKSKTIWFAFALVIVGMFESHLPELQTFMTPEYYGYATSITGIVVWILRWVTTKSLEEK